MWQQKVALSAGKMGCIRDVIQKTSTNIKDQKTEMEAELCSENVKAVSSETTMQHRKTIEETCHCQDLIPASCKFSSSEQQTENNKENAFHSMRQRKGMKLISKVTTLTHTDSS